MKILFCGGGTMGSVTPLLAIKEQLAKQEKNQFLWVGTKDGPEKKVVENKMIYKSIPCGKFRRYFSWRNFFDPFLIILGFLKSLWLIFRFKPDAVLTAGSFVCVPVVWAAAIFRKKIFVHQQDLKIGLANKLMKPCASIVTVAFDELSDKFKNKKVVVTGNPVREFLFTGSFEQAVSKFDLQNDKPVVLVMGGGLGSEVLNQFFIEASKELTKFCQIIHVLGKGAQAKWLNHPLVLENPNYHAYEFLTSELADAYQVASVVVARAGFSTLTELSALRKPAVIIPIPKNQQVENAKYFNNRKAIVYVRQEDLSVEHIVNLLEGLLQNEAWLEQLKKNIYLSMPQNASQEYASLINELIV